MRRFVLVPLLLLVFPCLALACLWDNDTLRMERQRFPSVLEVITGKFLRHSPEYYKWRVQDRLRKLEKDPTNLALLDDLGVSYDKLKQHEQAIATGLRCQALKADRYESEANLGTFYIHAGQPEKGLEYLRRAVQINPDAHFGREKYQIRLVEFVSQQKKKDPSKEPIREETLWDLVLLLTDNNQNKNRQEAVKGIAGMLHFGNHDSPILLSAMGAVLVDSSAPTEDGKMLGCRAFLRASYLVNDPEIKEEYRTLAKKALGLQVKYTETEEQMPLGDIEKRLQQELKEAEAWIGQIRADELSWIKEGKDVEAEFAKKYYQEPEISDHEDVTIISPNLAMWWRIEVPLAVLVGFLLVVGTLVWIVVRKIRRWIKAS